jgi:hypothetical protein
MSDLEVVSFRLEPGQYAWTFGGAAPVRRIRTPAALEVFTEDCFGGRVRSEQDLVSQVCEFGSLSSGGRVDGPPAPRAPVQEAG